jgi:hypothetical protein
LRREERKIEKAKTKKIRQVIEIFKIETSWLSVSIFIIRSFSIVSMIPYSNSSNIQYFISKFRPYGREGMPLPWSR